MSIYSKITEKSVGQWLNLIQAPEGFELTPETRGQVLEMLKLASNDNDIWRAVNILIAAEIKIAAEALCQSDASSDLRAFNSGRMAGLADFHALLTESALKAQVE